VDAGETVSRQCLGGDATLFLPTHAEPAKTGSFPVGGTLRLQAMREQSRRTFLTSC
jgi:hypothetical protein